MSKLRGNLIVGQSGGPTVVINQSLVGVIEAALGHSEIEAILGARHAIKGILSEDFIDLRKPSRETLEIVASTPCAALGSVRKKPTEDERKKVFDIFKKNNVRYFFYIGGNDSAETAHLLAEQGRIENYELRAFHVPKTIDNDLLVTDHCPGFGSAARFVALACMGDDLDNRSLPGIKINVVMGRKAGFLTAATALARQRGDDGPHLIYCPETVFDENQFLSDVEQTYKKLGRCIVAVSEGIHRADGVEIGATGEKDSHGNVQLSGTGALGDYLSGLIKKQLGAALRVRSDTFGYLQRSFPGNASEVDAKEARMAGRAAVAASVATDAPASGSIALRRTGNGAQYACETFTTELKNVAKNTRSMPPEFLHGSSGVTSAFLEYARPLAGPLPAKGFLLNNH
ncbi:MAG: 6-phosphofructokinase [Planctomycetota bacterium]